MLLCLCLTPCRIMTRSRDTGPDLQPVDLIWGIYTWSTNNFVALLRSKGKYVFKGSDRSIAFRRSYRPTRSEPERFFPEGITAVNYNWLTTGNEFQSSAHCEVRQRVWKRCRSTVCSFMRQLPHGTVVYLADYDSYVDYFAVVRAWYRDSRPLSNSEFWSVRRIGRNGMD